METKRLIERCRQGDADALGELYKAYAQRMRGVCRRYINDAEVIDDILHDAFVIIFTSFDKLRDDSKVESWMMSITRNVASKYKERMERMATVPLEETEMVSPYTERMDIRGVPLKDVLRMVERLPEGYGQVFRLSVFEGMSHKEIATMLGIEPHSSSSQLSRAKKMLRKMIQRYWAVLLLLLGSITFFLLKKENAVVKGNKPVVAKQKEEPMKSAKELPQQPEMVDRPVHHAAITATDTLKPTFAQATYFIGFDTLSNLTAHEQTIADTLQNQQQPDSAHYIQTILHDNLAALKFNTPTKNFSKKGWHLALAYAGTPSSDMTHTDNFMTMPSYSGTATRSTKLYNWGDYMNYTIQNADRMDSVDASNMNRIALINANNPWEPITETKHHERPKTYQFSLSKQLSNRWSLTTGIGYTYMKSTFEAGNDMTLIHRTQKLHYISIPFSLTHRIASGRHWMLYSSGGVQLDIPIKGRLTTQYLYNGLAKQEYPDSLIIPTSHSNIRAPWQWSVGAEVGFQYQIMPHVNAYIGPSLRYYIPTTGDTETYRTEHPFDLSLPFGIRFTW